jgi:tetrahydromethanopterin S-methyltransferase subunit B
MGKEHIEGSEIMIADELKILFDDLKGEITMVRAELILINHDLTQLREQMDKVESIVEHLQQNPQQQESIGIAPNTLPPDAVSIERM